MSIDSPDGKCTLRTQAGASHCDGMGHVNTRYIEAWFDDATAFFFGVQLGAEPQGLAKQGIGWADRKHTLEFLAEILSGDLIEVISHPLRVGTTSITLSHAMRNASTGRELARAEIVTVCFDLAARNSRRLPDIVLHSANRLVASSAR